MAVTEREDANAISKKKLHFPINERLRHYLHKYGREMSTPLSYNDLTHFTGGMAILDSEGNDTLWMAAMYGHAEIREIYDNLKLIYAMLATDGDITVIEHLDIERVEYCTFGNSKPFRIRLVNTLNGNHGYYYIKRADASRVYGLELEHILSPDKINFITDQNTLIEDHIAGVPGDVFIQSWMDTPAMNKTRMAKEFIKFNERCFVRLLGDMRSYNYVVDITPDFEDTQYRIRAIDFDQQSYEGRKSMYLPQYFKENNEVVKLCLKHVPVEVARQYQKEERTMIAKRLKTMRYRAKDLVDIMITDTISTPEKTDQLKKELAAHFDNLAFLKCRNMGEVVKVMMKVTLLKPMRRINEIEKQVSKRTAGLY